MDKHMKYLHRDVSWMYFNHRILQEAKKDSVPLLERLSFLGIYSNNLDEFFRVRVASISRIAEYDEKGAQEEHKHARALLKAINKLNNRFAKEFEETVNEVTACLKEERIHLVNENELDEEQRAFVHAFFHRELAGHLTPIWTSSIKRFDEEADDCIYLAVKMNRTGVKRSYYAFLPLPVSRVGRFVRLPDRDGCSYLMYLDDVVRCCLPLLFPGLHFDHYEAYSFKFTKDAEMEIDNDLRNGMLQKISKGVKSRRLGLPLRLIYDGAMPAGLLRRVMNKLDNERLDTALSGGKYQNHRDLMGFPDCGRKDLKYPAWPPILRREFAGSESLFDLIREKDRFLHVPYHDFGSYLRLLHEAAINPAVRSVKTTLYRLAKDSKVVKALIGAARNGKKVTVVIELLARFDEASNISWSKQMQDAGIHVIFGVEGLKVHSKITHIGFKTGADIACISTGNFHEGNARVYTDCLLLTANRAVVADVERVFHFIERPYSPVRFRELLVSPNDMKKRFLKLIDAEIKNHRAGRPAYIKMKVNHVTDPIMVRKIYEAAAAGVPVQLLVRGNCSLVTGQASLGGRLKIVGIIDRYLEHSRIFLFAGGGQEQCFIGSADWMPRNLDYRVEVVAPVYDPDIRAELHKIVDLGLNDTSQGRIVDGEGGELPLTPEAGQEAVRSQEALYKHYLELET